MLDREQALALLNELGPEKHLIQHALASEAVSYTHLFAVVAQADRPRPALSDMTVMQNGLMGETGLRRTMPHWPQPGLIPRDPARGDRLETIAYLSLIHI